jgi:Dolichyl-phosphate-mannose-protein mannosyltransferase
MSRSAIRNAHPGVCLVLGLALLLRALLPILGYCYTHDVTIFDTPDTESYVAPARELVVHQRFFSDGSPDLIRTPGYPLLLTVGLRLGLLKPATITLQVLLSCFTVFMVYRTAVLLFDNEEIAVIAAGLYAIDPLSILFASQLAAETLFTAVVMVGVYFLVKYLRRQSMGDLLVSAGALAASVYVRPIGYFLAVIIALGLAAWALFTHRQNKLRFLAHACAFVIVSFALTGLWQIRNKLETGYSGFSAIATDNLYFISAGSVLAAKQHVPYYEMRDRLGYQDQSVYMREHPEQKNWTAAQRVNYQSQAAKHILLDNPLTYAGIYFDGILRATFDPVSTEYLRFFNLYPKQDDLLATAVDQGILTTVEALFASPLLFWSIAVMLPLQLMYMSCACVTLCTRRILDPAIFAGLFIAGYYMAIAGGPGDWGRFRHPAMPIICMLAGYGFHLVLVWSRLRPQLQYLPDRFAISRLVGTESAASAEQLEP